jgi:exodeoxyribonuclease VII small subunit
MSETDQQKQSQPSFESALEQLQSTVRRLESGELSLEQALQGFEEGVRLTRLCQQQLSAAEQKVELLMQASASDGRVEFQPFQPGPARG